MPTSTDMPSPDPAPRLRDADTLRRMSAALPLVIRMLDELNLSRGDQAVLIGLHVRGLQRGLNGKLPSLSEDQVTRLSLLSGIYQALLRTYPPESAARWLIQPRQDAPFYDQTPLAYVRKTGIPGLYATRQLLDAAAQGNFTSSLEDRRRASGLLQPAIDLSHSKAPER